MFWGKECDSFKSTTLRRGKRREGVPQKRIKAYKWGRGSKID